MTIKTFALKITLGAALALGVAACGNQTSTPGGCSRTNGGS